jgi:uncharacterized Tic20 family protein
MSQEAAPTREDQLVAGLCHAAILMPLIGIAVPLAVWLSQRERSALLRENGLQALVFQFSALGLYVVAYACQFCSIFLLPLTALLIPGSTNTPSTPGDVSPLAFVFPAIFSLGTCVSALVQCIGWPAFSLFGLRAAWQIGHGRTFDYPLLGAWLRRHTAVPPKTDGGEPAASTP